MKQINPGLVGRLLIGQTLLGTIDGVNTVFTTMQPFLRVGGAAERVYLRGVRRCEGPLADYQAVESGGVGTGYDTIVFANPPRPGDNLLIDYYPSGL